MSSSGRHETKIGGGGAVLGRSNKLRLPHRWVQKVDQELLMYGITSV